MTAPLLLHVFATFAVGGPQIRFAAIANHFGRRWRHAIVAMDSNFSAAERLSPDLDIDFPNIEIRKGDTLGNLRRFRATLRALRPRTLVTSNWGSIEWALANAPPLSRPLARHVHMEDGFGPEERDRQLPRRVLMRRLALRRSLVVVPSLTLRSIASERWRLDPRRLRTVPNGVDLARFGRGGTAAAPWALPGGAPVIGTVAALRPEKNIGRLLAAVAALPADVQACLVVVGDGPERATLEARAEALGLAGRVAFPGHLADPAGAYRHFDVFALSSDTEQMPLSVLEAMAAGLPVAATDVGDVAAMLAPENRQFVVAPTAEALAGGLGALLGDAGLRRAVGQANRTRAERDFAQVGMFESYAALFDGPG